MRRAIALIAALCVALLSVPASAQLLMRGFGSGSASGITAPSYQPLGVAFDGAVTIAGPQAGCALGAYNCSLNGGTSQTAHIGWWQFIARAQPATANTLSSSNPFDPIRTLQNVGCELGKSVCMANDNTTNKMQLNFYDSTGGAGHGFDITGTPGQPSQTDGKWEFFELAYDASNGTSSRWAIYRNGTLAGCNSCSGSTGDFTTTMATTTVDWNNDNRLATVGDPKGIGFINGNPTNNSWGYLADVFVDIGPAPLCTGVNTPATMYGMAVTCPQASVIPVEIRNKSYNPTGGWAGTGGPVQHAANCSDVSNGTSVPIICVYGDNSAFATNHGTADSQTGSAATAFSVQALKTGGSVWTPPFGPSGVPGGVAVNHQFQANNTQTACAATPCTFTIDASNIAAQLSTGDFAIVFGTIDDATSFFTSGQTFACSSPGSTVWTLTTVFQSGIGHKEMAFACTGFLAANDLGGQYSLTWQSGALGSRYRAIALATYKNVSGVDDIQTIVSNATTVSQCAPATTATATGDTLVAISSNFNANVTSHLLTPPATGMTRLRISSTATPGQLAMVDKNAITEGTPLGTGTIAGLCWTNSAADSYEAISILLKHN